MDRPEHRLQIAVVKWCRNQVTERHVLLCFDRSKPHSARQHLWESQRGIIAGTPDAVLCLGSARAAIWLEFKAPGGKPSENQKELGARLRSIGHPWEIVASVDELRALLDGWGVKLAGTAQWAAQETDARLQGARPEPKAAKKPRKPRVRHSPGRLAAI